MTVPVVESNANATAINSSTFTINKPSGVVEGDLMVAMLGCTAGQASAPTPPSGWTEIHTEEFESTDWLGSWYKEAGASEGANYQWGNGVASQTEWAGGIVRVSGHDSANIIDAKAKASYTGTDDPDAPSVTTTVDDTLILRHMANDWNGGGSPASHTELWDLVADNRVNDVAAHTSQASAGATGTAAFDLNGFSLADSATETIAIGSPAATANPKGPFGLALHGPFGGPV